jgi:hypothetical protein
MKKYEVFRENHVEAIRGAMNWSVNDMLNFESNRTSTYHELIGSFDTKEEAQQLFEEEKKTCSSYYQDGNVFKLVLFDYLALEENEYDEDGDFVETLGIWDKYVEPIEEED